jgi:hypothetical protein
MPPGVIDAIEHVRNSRITNMFSETRKVAAAMAMAGFKEQAIAMAIVHGEGRVDHVTLLTAPRRSIAESGIVWSDK